MVSTSFAFGAVVVADIRTSLSDEHPLNMDQQHSVASVVAGKAGAFVSDEQA